MSKLQTMFKKNKFAFESLAVYISVDFQYERAQSSSLNGKGSVNLKSEDE